MKNNLLKIYLAFLLIFSSVFSFLPDYARADLNNSLVISDSNFHNFNTMTAVDINNFLIAKGSRLADYVVPQYVTVTYPLAAGGLGSVDVLQQNDAVTPNIPLYGKTVAQLIYDETQEHQVNPYVILATLEKESSAITGNVFRSSTVAAWPMFYMYDETMASCLNYGTNCNDTAYRNTAINYGGVGQQIAYATAWFGRKYTDYSTTGRCISWDGNGVCNGREQYNDPISIDGNSITCQSVGTRILYLYTPHVQTSFYNIYSNFFGDPTSSAPPTSIDDVSAFSGKTFNATFPLSGSKRADLTAYYTNSIIGAKNSASWSITFSLNLGQNNFQIDYKDDGGNIIESKLVTITRSKLGDSNDDGVINISDLSILSDHWGKSVTANTAGDLNGDGAVNIADLSILSDNWGK